MIAWVINGKRTGLSPLAPGQVRGVVVINGGVREVAIVPPYNYLPSVNACLNPSAFTQSVLLHCASTSAANVHPLLLSPATRDLLLLC